ncbi:MAG: excinuclease ABC subunit UvrA [Clostridia bacterium]|nr:excinuclease ABC subunit UvrA [Clostridia bacterium]
MKDFLVIKGARENNLKDIDLTIPRDKMVVFTGLSGSGKSTLAFQTIYAEGQRRYVESLSSYARMFLGQMEKPDVDLIEGLSPAISIDQKTTSHNPRSTVGTVTEIYDYLRLLFARVGVPHCPKCGREISRQTIEMICDKILALPEGSKILINSPVVRGKKGEYQKQFDQFRKSGYARVEVDGVVYDLEEEIKLDKNKKHDVSVVIDRLIVKEGIDKRLSDSVEQAVKLSGGLVSVQIVGGESLSFSTKYACPDCEISIEEIEPRLFSFNNPFGACPDCHGIGYKNVIDPSLVVKDVNKSLREGAMTVSGWNLDSGKMAEMNFTSLANYYGFSLDVPVKDLPKEIVDMLLYGNGGERIKMEYSTKTFSGSYFSAWEGIIPNLERRYRETTSDFTKSIIEKLMTFKPCETCGGKRLKKEALSVTVGGLNIAEMTDRSVGSLYDFIQNLRFGATEQIIAKPIIKEIKARLKFLIDVGLNYLTLSRNASTLSGGEAQRIRLATQIGSGLTGVLYILDEPSIGLHQRDNQKLISTLKHLRDLGNTLIIVEHDEDTMREADFIVDIGPKAGVHGGEIVATGSISDIINEPRSITGDYLSGRRKIEVPSIRKAPDGRWLTVKGANQNNLKNVDVSFPVGLFTVVTGVSGSGKSSLVNEILYPHLAVKLNNAKMREGSADAIEGVEHFDKVIAIDQSPIGKTPRSNPATYTGVFAPIRDIFASTPDAKERGYKAGRFSFNVSGGRCEHCEGDGAIKIEMHFLPDMYVPCEACKGKRYNRETLQVKYKGKNVSEVLEMTVDEACEFFKAVPVVFNKLKTLQDVGLGYIKLGQSSTTLSGGEAQRVKLATELSKRSTGRTLYILDEPTTGLSSYDIEKLCKVLLRLQQAGNTIVVIEHNLDVIKLADYVIDLGPEGGDGGGRVIATGTPEEVALNENSYTGEFLNKILNG